MNESKETKEQENNKGTRKSEEQEQVLVHLAVQLIQMEVAILDH